MGLKHADRACMTAPRMKKGRTAMKPSKLCSSDSDSPVTISLAWSALSVTTTVLLMPASKSSPQGPSPLHLLLIPFSVSLWHHRLVADLLPAWLPYGHWMTSMRNAQEFRLRYLCYRDGCTSNCCWWRAARIVAKSSLRIKKCSSSMDAVSILSQQK